MSVHRNRNNRNKTYASGVLYVTRTVSSWGRVITVVCRTVYGSRTQQNSGPEAVFKACLKNKKNIKSTQTPRAHALAHLHIIVITVREASMCVEFIGTVVYLARRRCFALFFGGKKICLLLFYDVGKHDIYIYTYIRVAVPL